MAFILGGLTTLIIFGIGYLVWLLTQTNATTHKGARTDWKTSRRSWEEDPEFYYVHRRG